MKIAILGMGKIGSGVYEFCASGKEFEVKRILDLKVWMENMTTDIDDIVNDAEIEAVVETMGGLEPARTYALKCLNAKKHYITANKFLVSEAMEELKEAADRNGVGLMFSAACGGGMPVLKSLADQKCADNIVSFGGILNGTTNYMLDRIENSGLSYEEALKEAQALGYAEADPTSDVDGLDAQRKLILALAVGFGCVVKAEAIPTAGIRKITPMDIRYFSENGLSPRLIAEAVKDEAGICASVSVHLFKKGAPESAILKNINYAHYTGEKSGLFSFSGQGAGKYPTAANVIGDLVRIKAGQKHMLPEDLKPLDKIASCQGVYYVRVPEEEAEIVKDLFDSFKTENACVYGVTVPVNTKDIFDRMNQSETGFFARID